MSSKAQPVVLLILDGWGQGEPNESNAISNARTPVWDQLLEEVPHTTLNTSGDSVGLPGGQMGNSEVGHLNLGAGRVVYQELTRITRAIENGEFFNNPALVEAVDGANRRGGAVHILGLLSSGGVHSHQQHIEAMLQLALQRGCKAIYLHAFLDGRDTPPRSATEAIQSVEALLGGERGARIATLVGRYYAMDRDQRWERVEAAYDLLTLGESTHVAESPLEALQAAYARGENDEFVAPTRIGEAVPMGDGDAVIFMNFRADRARQITEAFTAPQFSGFPRKRHPELSAFVSLTEYSESLSATVAFPSESVRDALGEVLSRQGLRQLRLAETEKYAHVTFFFNGGRDEPFAGEERILVPSPRVATYDLQPEMSLPGVTEHLVAAIEKGDHEVIICNFANADMVGHTGVFAAAVQAIEALDSALGKVVDAVRRADGVLLITADHGNAEQMADPATGQPHTAHTSNPVPLLLVGRTDTLSDSGALCDIAPTLLQLIGVEPPAAMTGHTLLHQEGSRGAAS